MGFTDPKLALRADKTLIRNVDIAVADTFQEWNIQGAENANSVHAFLTEITIVNLGTVADAKVARAEDAAATETNTIPKNNGFRTYEFDPEEMVTVVWLKCASLHTLDITAKYCIHPRA